jgi:hypothetical protein
MTYVIIFILYGLDALVFAIKNLADIDLYEGNDYHNLLLVVRATILLYLGIRIVVLRRYKGKLLQPAMERGFLMLYGAVLLVTIGGYLANDFILRYVLRDVVTNTFTVAMIHALVLEHSGDRRAFEVLRNVFRALFVFHVLGIVILTIIKFDAAFILDKVFLHPLERRTYEEGRLYFFALAGNEEAYTILIYSLMASIGWRPWVKIALLVANLLFFVYLGTRTVFFFSVFILVIWPLVMFRSVETRLFVTEVLILLLAFFWERIYLLLVTAFDFLPTTGGTMDLSALMQEDTLGWRIMFVWAQLLDELLRGVNVIFGISVNGLSELSKSGEEQLTAVHNAFLYFLGVSGIVGLYVYMKGYAVMIRSIRRRLVEESGRASDGTLSFALSGLVMVVYALMNNAYSIQGMVTYSLLIVFALVALPGYHADFALETPATSIEQN